MYCLFKKNKFIPGVLSEDPWDGRDYELATIQAEVVKLPESFDLRDQMTSVQSQNWGTCTSHMADGQKEFLDSKEYHKEIKLSQKFIYINTKKISGLWDTQGDFLRNALKSVCTYGACLETTFPDVKRTTWEKYVREEPSAEAYKEAEKYKGKTYWSVGRTLENFRQAMFQQKAPVGFGMMWYKSYDRLGTDGRLSLPNIEKGGHAIIAVGWTKDKLWVRNSWGAGYGLNGYFYIPFDEFNKHNIWNAWILTDLAVSENLSGWVAEKYLQELGPRFHQGDIITPIVNLNLREKPTVKSGRVALLRPGQKLEVLEGNVQGGAYKWWKIKVKT